MTYQHPLAYLVGLEGLALMRAWAGDFDEEFVRARLAEVRELLDDPTLAAHPGVQIEDGATAAAYAQWAAGYDDPENGLLVLDLPVIDEILDALPTGVAVDTACGTGRLARRLSERGYDVTGVDDSPAMLEQAGRLHPEVCFIMSDMRRLPQPDDSVDLVTNALALTHVADLDAVLAEFARVLRPGGAVIISDVHPELAYLGSVVKAEGRDGQPQLAATYRRSVGEFLQAVLAAGFTVRRFEELARPDPEPPPDTPEEGVRELGTWREWPWTLLEWMPAATRAAWDNPAMFVWHLQHG